MKFFKLNLILILGIFLFTGCVLNQSSSAPKSLTWDEMFDSKKFVPVNKDQNLTINSKKVM